MKSINHHLEKHTQQKDEQLKSLARSKAILYATRNLPGPDEDSIMPYIKEIEMGYASQGAEGLKLLQPDSHLPEAKIEHDLFLEKKNLLILKTQTVDHQINILKSNLGSYNSKEVIIRLKWVIIATFIISLGDVIYNTKSFQVTGENMLMSFILSISISFTVMLFSHIIVFFYKNAKTLAQKRLFALAAIGLIIIVFSVLGIFRSKYLAIHDVHLNPIYFVVINLLFFVVSAMLSFLALPTWQELKQNAINIRLYQSLMKKKNVKSNLEVELHHLKEQHAENLKERVRAANEAKHYINVIEKKFQEAAAIFSGTNLSHRTDGLTPKCFHQNPQPLYITQENNTNS